MATPLTDAITALTTYANTVTGASDTTLSDAVGTLAAGYGGGGSSPWTKVDEIVLSENVRTVNIDTTGYQSTYDFVVGFYVGELTSADYIYVTYNNTTITTSGGYYTTIASVVKTPLFMLTKRIERITIEELLRPNNNTFTSTANVTVNNIFLNTYQASKLMKAGSKIVIYGLKYADL
jgi:hypothetical protein